MSGTQSAVDLLKQADEMEFGLFVQSIVTNVFDTIIQSQVSQLKTYGDLVEQMSKTLEEYQEGATGLDFASGATAADNQAELDKYIEDVLKFDLGQIDKSDAYPLDSTEYKLLENHLGEDLDDDSPANVTPPPATGGEGKIQMSHLRELIFAKLNKETSRRRDLLLEVLRLGFARVDVTNGEIKAGMVLRVSGLDEELAFSQASDVRANNWHAGGSVNGVFKKIGFGIDGRYNSSRFRVKTSSERSTSRTTVDGTLTGEVRIGFATTYFEPRLDLQPGAGTG